MPRILLADDDVAVLETLRMYLDSSGHEVVATATTGEEALDLARTTKPELVLMDIVMSDGIDGVEAADTIRSEMAIPTILITGCADESYRERAAQSQGYLEKPFDLELLLAEIDRVLN